MGRVTVPSRLLEVALHGRLGAHLRLVGVLVVLALGPPLPEQVPALVQVCLEPADPLALLVGVLRGLAELVLLVDQRVDAAEDVGLVHAHSLPYPSGTQPTRNADIRPVIAPPARPTASRAARSSGTRTARAVLGRVATACPAAISSGQGRSSCACTRARASAVGTALPSTIAVTTAGSLPITRVPSRKLPAARASASEPASAAAAARAAAKRC